MTIVEEILDVIETKTSWGKTQLKEEILKLLAKRFDHDLSDDLLEAEKKLPWTGGICG